jgi:carbamoyltransferase
MKLLGLRICEHDSNLSFFDGNEVHYIKTERIKNIKHHAYNQFSQEYFSEISSEWESDIKDIWGIKYQDIDQIGIVFDPSLYGFPEEQTSIFPHINYIFPYKNIPVLRIDHHYAHALSDWPIYNKDIDTSIIIDGYGDYNIAWTVFKHNKIIDQGYVFESGSLGIEMAEAGRKLGLKSKHDNDYAGKVMGLQSYGKIDSNLLSILKKYNLNTINKLFNFNLKPKNLSPIDWINTVHYRVGEVLIEFFSKYCSSSEVISYSGGVAQNVVWNKKLKDKFPNLIISPHCGDEGLSLGIIEYLRKINNLPRFKPIDFPYIGHNIYDIYQKKLQLKGYVNV